MPYQNDMATMADIIGPAYAAQQAGIQNAAANQEQDIHNQILQAQAPALSQEAGLNNLFNQARTASTQASTTGETLKNIGTAGTLGSSINATNSGNQLKISQDQLNQMNQLGVMANAIAAQMDNVPAAARPAMMQQITQQYGIDPSKLGNMMSGDPQMLRQVSQAMIQGSAGYMQSIGEINARGAQTIANTQEENKGRADVATIAAGSRENVAETNAQAKRMMMKTDNIIAQLTAKQAQGALSPDEANTLNQARQAQQLVRTNPFINQMLDNGASSATNQMPVAQPGSTQGTPDPTSALRAELQRRGLIK